jgi:hypothetical protein
LTTPAPTPAGRSTVILTQDRPSHSKTFDNRDQAKIWIINNQLSRRNLTPEQSSNLRGMRYELEKKQNGERGPEKPGQNDQAFGTAEKIAKETGVSARTIRRDAQFSQAVDKMTPEEKADVLAGRAGYQTVTVCRGFAEPRQEE